MNNKLTASMKWFLLEALHVQETFDGIGCTALSHYASANALVRRGLLKINGSGVVEGSSSDNDVPIYVLTAEGRKIAEQLYYPQRTQQQSSGLVDKKEK